MRRLSSLLLVGLCGCSTAPVADFLDIVRPAQAVRRPTSDAPLLPAFTPPPAAAPVQPPAEPNAPPPPQW